MNIERLIAENPNLSYAAISRLTGMDVYHIKTIRELIGVKQNWKHSGVGIPFVCFSKKGASFRVSDNKNRYIYEGSFNGAMENVDRVIYALDNGGLPKRKLEGLFDNLDFIKG